MFAFLKSIPKRTFLDFLPVLAIIRGCVDSIDITVWPDAPFGGDRECSGAAAHVQDRLADFEARQFDHLLL
jgi:hypothetical protein